jgi:hypothetical protein
MHKDRNYVNICIPCYNNARLPEKSQIESFVNRASAPLSNKLELFSRLHQLFQRTFHLLDTPDFFLDQDKILIGLFE